MKYDEERQRIRENLKNENKTTYRIDEDNIMLGILFCIVGFLVLVCDALFCDWWGGFIVVAVLAIASGLLLVYIECSKKSDLNKAVEEEISRLEKKEQEHQRQNQLGITGQWEFPAEEFYCRCEKNKIQTINNEYGFNKAKLIAEQLIRDECPMADISSFSDYLEREKLQSFIELGKLKAQKTAEAENMRKKKAKCADPTPKEAAFLKRTSEVQHLTGCNKRVKMLTDLVDDCETEYQRAKSEEDVWKQLAIVQGMQQQKEKDWSIRAGAANGIAGPVAGIATVLDTMQENEKIRMYNQDVRSAADGYIAKAAATFDGQAKAKAAHKRLEKSIEEARATIALPNPNADTLWENMKVNYDNAFISKSKSGVLNVSVDIRLIRPVHLDVPDGVKMVIDGTIAADVMYEGNKIGEVAFLLPILGMPCDEPAAITLKGMCQNSTGFDNGYTLEMKTKQNLWVMEAASNDSVRAVERFFELYRPGETADQCNEKHSAYFDKYEYNQKKAFFNDEAAENEDMPTRINKFLMMAEKPMTLSEIKAVVNTSTVAETRELMDPAIEAGSIKKEVVKGRVVYSWNGE